MFKTDALDNVANAYVDENTGTSTPGTRLEADDQNIKQDELTNAVEDSGQTLDASGVFTNNDQVSRAMAIYGAGGGGYHIDTGVVNAYELDPVGSKKSPPAYFDGFTVSFEPSVVNISASTVDVASLGVVDIVDISGSALTGGEISGPVDIRYKNSIGKFVLISQNELIQSVNTQDSSFVEYVGATIIPLDNTKPQNTEGEEVISRTITPTESSNILEITITAVFSHSASSHMIVALFQDAIADALAVVAEDRPQADSVTTVPLTWRMVAGTTSEIDFKVRAGSNAAGNLEINGRNSAALFDGVSATSIIVKEFKP